MAEFSKTLKALALLFLAKERPVGIVLEEETVLAQALAAARYCGGYGAFDALLPATASALTFPEAREPTADVLQWAIHQAYATSENARSRYKLDSASNLAHDPMSLQQNRAVISITTATAEAIPVANYLPADIGSNEAPLVIVSHEAGSTFGHYGAGDLMDGVLSGRAYTSAQRTHLLKRTGDDFGGKVTPIQLTADTCDQDAPSAKLLKGRTIIYINGLPAAKETSADAPAGARSGVRFIELSGVAEKPYAGDQRIPGIRILGAVRDASPR